MAPREGPNPVVGEMSIFYWSMSLSLLPSAFSSRSQESRSLKIDPSLYPCPLRLLSPLFISDRDLTSSLPLSLRPSVENAESLRDLLRDTDRDLAPSFGSLFPPRLLQRISLSLSLFSFLCYKFLLDYRENGTGK